MEVGSFPKRPDRGGMPIRAYRDIFTACFELNSILYYELISKFYRKVFLVPDKYHSPLMRHGESRAKGNK